MEDLPVNGSVAEARHNSGYNNAFLKEPKCKFQVPTLSISYLLNAETVRKKAGFYSPFLKSPIIMK